MKSLHKLFCFAFLFWGNAFSQVLTPEDAVSIALKNNYSIHVQRNNMEIARNDASPGNAGMLPQVSFNAGASRAGNNTRQELLNGTTVDKKNAISSGANAGLGVSWTLFDGMKMFASLEKLRETRDQSETELKIEIETTVAAVLTNYFDLVKQKQLITFTENTLKLYEERMKIAEARWKIGSGSKMDYLQAKVDMNEQRSFFLQLKNTYATLKINLNTLMAQDAEKDFDVADSIPLAIGPSYEELKKTVPLQNRQLLWQRQNINIANFKLKESRSELFPRISLNSNYNFNRTENQAGFILLNQNLGLNGGITASWNIFNGNSVRRQVKNSQIEILNAKLVQENARSAIESSLLKAWNDLQSAKEILVLEEENHLAAKENAEVALERFRLGNATTIEVKEAQKSLDDAQVRLVNARFNAKLAEIELTKLNGGLVR